MLYIYTFTEETLARGIEVLHFAFGEKSKVYKIKDNEIQVKKIKNAAYFANQLACCNIKFESKQA